MSYFCADSGSYLDDVASIGGLTAFRKWAHLQGGLIDEFIDAGYTHQPAALAEALAAATASEPAVDSVRQGLLACAQRADGMLILTDGMTDIEDVVPLTNEVEKERERPSGGPFSGPSMPMPPRGPDWTPRLPPAYKDDEGVFHDIVKAATHHHEPELKHALLRAWKAAAMGMSMTEARVGLREKDWSRVQQALDRGNLAGHTREVLVPRAAAAYLRGVELAARPLRRLGMQFRGEDEAEEKAGPSFHMGRMNPYAAEWAHARAGELVDEPQNVQRLIRDFVELAVEDGFTVDEVADLIQGIIGLDGRRAMALEAYAADLHDDGIAGAEFTTAYDGYVADLLASRAETIARTEILMATNAGQQGLWNEAVTQGLLDNSLQKSWIVTEDETTCDECNAMADLAPVGIDESFDSDDGAIEFPPLHPNCRCTIGLVAAEGGD